MARPNVLTFKSYGGGGAIQMVSNVEFHTIADQVLEKFALSEGPGNIYANTVGSNANYTAIGTFTDTRTAAVGVADATITSITTTFYQDKFANNIGSFSDRPLTWDATSESIRQVSNTELDAIGDDIVTHLVDNDAPGAYRIAATSPSATYGGTWAVLYTFTNNIDPTNSANTYYLYEKIASDTTMEQRPLRVQSGGTLQLMSNTQVETLAEVVRSRILTTEIGTYAFQETVPVTGTWVGVGSVVDTRRDITGISTNYVGPANYTGPANFAGTANFVGPATFFGTRSYIGVVGPVNFTGSGTFFGPATYFGLRNFTGFAPMQAFAGIPVYVDEDYPHGIGPYYYGPGLFGGPVQQYISNVPQSYTGGPFPFYGIGGFTGPVNYTGFSNSTTIYTGGPFGFVGVANFAGPANFAGTANFSGFGTFTGFVPTVQSSISNITTYTLWRRVG